jgi:NAD(P)-dependent dehydrogenase (short-subunit alcohol dehydrogenase family)
LVQDEPELQASTATMLANELGDTGITVNAIAPGIVNTEGFRTRPRPSGATAEQTLHRLVPMQTIKCPAVPAGMAGALAFLVSDDAGFITGQILYVDGGTTRTGACGPITDLKYL